jgi:hypothetical protein
VLLLADAAPMAIPVYKQSKHTLYCTIIEQFKYTSPQPYTPLTNITVQVQVLKHTQFS